MEVAAVASALAEAPCEIIVPVLNWSQALLYCYQILKLVIPWNTIK